VLLNFLVAIETLFCVRGNVVWPLIAVGPHLRKFPTSSCTKNT